MDVLTLSRIQFGATIAFHYIYPPLSIGLGIMLVLMEGAWLKTGNTLYHQMARFWTKVFALTFAIGVATGIVMEFEFGTNWATYSRFVGDVFGSALAAEGIFAFFLESGFLAVLLFGWDKVGRKLHFFSTCMVALGAHFSAVWIVVANSWMQTPAGYHIVGEGMHARAEITDFWQLVFNPSMLDRLFHTICGAWCAGSFLVVSVSAWYLLKGKHLEFARKSLKVGLTVALVSTLLQAVTGHKSAQGLEKNQPAKLAAFEGLYETTSNAPLVLVGWPDEKNEKVIGISAPGMLSFLTHNDFHTPVIGLNEFKPEDRPPVTPSFLFFHAMVGIGFTLIARGVAGLFIFPQRHAARTPLAVVDSGFLRAWPATCQSTRLVRRRSRAAAVDCLWLDANARRFVRRGEGERRFVVADFVHADLFAAVRRFHLSAQRQNPARPG